MNEYDDIINLPYEGVRHHRRMARAERAVIMSAFDALTGLGNELANAAREVEEQALDDGLREMEW